MNNLVKNIAEKSRNDPHRRLDVVARARGAPIPLQDRRQVPHRAAVARDVFNRIELTARAHDLIRGDVLVADAPRPGRGPHPPHRPDAPDLRPPPLRRRLVRGLARGRNPPGRAWPAA